MMAKVTVRGYINGMPVFPQYLLVIDRGDNTIELEETGYLSIRIWPGVSYTVTVQYAA